MISYRFRRRAFLGALGGGVGLKIMLRNAELSAQRAPSPPRFLLTYWPLAIVPGVNAALWTPTKGAAGGHALQPFLDQGLADDMITLRGINTGSLALNGGGSREAGTTVFVTGVPTGGTRVNRGESDDGFATGPSIDQILLKNAPGLAPAPGNAGYANSICDYRTDLGEISAKCLSYSYEQQPVSLYNGGTGVENKPLMATLSPFGQYTALFSAMRPGTGAGGSSPTAQPAGDELLKQLAMRRSVLDFGLAELNRMRALVPSTARSKLEIHFDAVEKVEAGLTATINSKYPVVTGAGGNGGRPGSGGGVCPTTPAPPADVKGTPDWTSGGHGSYGNPTQDATDDIATHQRVGQLHMDVLRAAFVCDLIRCGTFQWAPSTTHVGFKGLFPGDDARSYKHHSVSHSLPNGSTAFQGTTPDEIPAAGVRFLFNVERWYFARQAENLKKWKDAVDGFGNPLLDTTIIPFVTETGSCHDERDHIPGMIFGGKKLGMRVGQYKTGNFPVNSLWATIAQALGCPSGVASLSAPIPDLWSPPAP